MSQYDPHAFWGDPIQANRPHFYRECCICGNEVGHGQQYRAARGLRFVHATCKDRKDREDENRA